MYHIPSEGLTLNSVRELKHWALPTLLSKRPTAGEIEPLGAFIVQIDPQPDITATQVAEPGEVTHENGVSRRGWIIRDATEQELRDSLPYQSKEEAKEQVLQWADNFLQPLRKGYSQSEIDSWPVKGPAAIRFVNGDALSSDTFMLQAEADALQLIAPGTTAAQVAAAIKPRAEPYLEALAFTSALRQIVNAQINHTTDLLEIVPILKNAKAAAAAKAADLGLEIDDE